MKNLRLPLSFFATKSLRIANRSQLLLLATAPLSCGLASSAQAAQPIESVSAQSPVRVAQANKPVATAQTRLVQTPAMMNNSDKPTGIRNVVMIFADDMGYDMSCVGTQGIETPNLDKMVAQGTLFTNGYAAQAVCSPSRGALMTGTYPNWNGIDQLTTNAPITGFPTPNNVPKPFTLPYPQLRADVPTMIEQLRDSGFYQVTTQKTHVQPIWRFPFDKGFNYHRDPAQYNGLIDEVKNEAGAKPFYIMANISPPHRPFLQHLQQMKRMDGKGRPKGIDAAKIFVPPYLPDTPAMRGDLAEYYANKVRDG